MTELPFDKYQLKGPMADYGYKVSFDLPESAGEILGNLMKQEKSGYIIVMNEEEYQKVREK